MGVVSAAIKFGGLELFMTEWNKSVAAQILAVVMYIAIIVYLILASLKAKKDNWYIVFIYDKKSWMKIQLFLFLWEG